MSVRFQRQEELRQRRKRLAQKMVLRLGDEDGTTVSKGNSDSLTASCGKHLYRNIMLRYRCQTNLGQVASPYVQVELATFGSSRPTLSLSLSRIHPISSNTSTQKETEH
jgi:hypothetical protein